MLRSMRYGEADRILHVYTPQRGRVSAIAKGVRRARSRFGGRLEPFFRLTPRAARRARRAADGDRRARRSSGHAAPARRRARAGRRRARVRRGGAAVRDRRAAPGRVQPALPQAGAARRAEPAAGATRRADALAFRLKLLVAAGLAPQLGRVRVLRRARAPRRVLRARPGASCAARVRRCRSRSSEQAYGFMTEALGQSLSEVPERAGARRWARSSARSPRRSSTTRTCG